jgi:hypothetical protein
VTNQYQNEFSCYSNYQTVGLKDMALPNGGVFDLGSGGIGNWTQPHNAHDRGNAADFRWSVGGGTNSVIDDPNIVSEFLNICQTKGLSYAIKEDVGTSNQHIHCSTSSSGF